MSGGDSSTGDGGDTSRDDGGTTRTVRFVETGPVELLYRESYGFTVEVAEEGGPAVGTRVDLALENAQDSSLDSTTLVTGADGLAYGTVVAATVSVSFSVRASLATGEAAYLEFLTNPPRDVRVTLDPHYTGDRRVSSYEVVLTPGATCPAAYPGPSEPGTSVTISVPAADPTFSVDRGLLLAALEVSVAGIDGGEALTWGCVDTVAVPPAGLPSLVVALIDLPWPRPGTHTTKIELPFATLGSATIDAAFAPFAALLAGEVSTGAFILDGIGTALHASGNDPIRAVLDARRPLDLLDDAAAAVAPALTAGPDPLAAIREGARTFLGSAWVEGQLDLGEADGTGNASSLDRWLSLNDGTTGIPFVGPGDPLLDSVARAIPSSGSLDLRQHEFPLSLGRLVELVLDAQLGAGTGSWTAALSARLAELIPCDAVAAALAVSADLAAVCDAACLAPFCTAWRDGLAAASGGALAAAELDYTTLNVISATCTFLTAEGGLDGAGDCVGTATAHFRGMSETGDITGGFAVFAAPYPLP
jgi:hypothetical protein